MACDQFFAVRERGELTSVLVPQRVPEADAETVYPLHIFLLKTIDSEHSILGTRRAVGFDGSDRQLLVAVLDRAFKIYKAEFHLSAAILLGNRTEKNIAILLGSLGHIQVGFAALEMESVDARDIKDLTEEFKVHHRRPGSTVQLPSCNVRVDVQTRARRGIKAYEVHVTVRRQAIEDGE